MTKDKQTKSTFIWLLLGVFITSLDSGIISTSMTSISRYFHVEAVSLSWTVSVYTLSLVIATPIMANVIDRYGYKKTFLAELILYFIGIVGIYLSSSYSIFLLFRVFQAFGNSSILTVAISYILSNYQDKKGARVGIVGMLTALGSIVAPIISVINLAITHNWKNIYLVFAILILFLFIMVSIKLPNLNSDEKNTFDIWGTFWLIVSVTSFMLAISGIIKGKYAILAFFCLCIITIFTFILFLRVEKRKNQTQQYAIFSSVLWQNSQYKMALIGGLLCGLFMTSFVYLPSLIEQTFHLPSKHAGSFMTLMGLGTIFGAMLAGKYVDKKGTIYTTKFATLFLILSFFLFIFSKISIVFFSLVLILFGFAIGMLMTSPLQVMIGEINEEKKNSSLSFLSITKKIGMSIGTLVSGVIFQLLARTTLQNEHLAVFFSIELFAALLLYLAIHLLTRKKS